ncbi:MAG: segregation/condensation protein A [Candidatus Omnitrophota bacterium]
MTCKLHLERFEGPLDLLLYLIRKDEVDIYDIPIAQVTDQYIQYIDMMKMLDLDGIGDFLVMAATLLQIKSKMLLPPDPAEVKEPEDPRTELVRRLEEYQLIKEAAEQLRLKAEQRQDFFARRTDEEVLAGIREDNREVYFEANLFDLITALTQAMANKPVKSAYEVQREEYTVEEKVHNILQILIDRPRILLRDLFAGARDRLELIVTFMAVLELCKMKEVVIAQKRMFADIELLRQTDNIVVQQPPDA